MKKHVNLLLLLALLIPPNLFAGGNIRHLDITEFKIWNGKSDISESRDSLLSIIEKDSINWIKQVAITTTLLENSNSVWRRVRLPKEKWDSPHLFLTAYCEGLEVYYAGKQIYNYPQTSSGNGFKYYYYHLIPIRPDSNHSYLFIRTLYSNPLDRGYIINLSIGPWPQVLEQMTATQIATTASIVNNLILGILSMLAGLFVFVFYYKRIQFRENKLLIFSVLSLLGGIRSINSYSFATIIPMPPVLSDVLFISTMVLIPIAMIALIRVTRNFSKDPLIISMLSLHIIFVAAAFVSYFMTYRVINVIDIYIIVLFFDIFAYSIFLLREIIIKKNFSKALLVYSLLFLIFLFNDLSLHLGLISWIIALYVWSLILAFFAYGYIIEHHLRITNKEISSKNFLVEELKRKNLEIQYEALKDQLTPHFLFNTLNTLSAIIEDDPKMAVEFVDELSNVYRYVLQCSNKNLVELAQEIEFIKSYTYLLKKRFGNSLIVNISVDDDSSRLYLPVLTIQLLVENVIKHNVISSKHPLSIDIFIEGKGSNRFLVVKNGHKTKKSDSVSNKLGITNIVKRYENYTDRKIEIIATADDYQVRVPLLAM